MTSLFINKDLSQSALTEEEYLLRKEFAKLFCRHHNAHSACVELGFAQPYVDDWAKALMADCVVRKLIHEEQEFLASEKGLKTVEQEVINKLRALGDLEGPGSSHGARVSAWTNVGRLLGMETTKTETNVTHKGGVMMVPALTNPDQWGELAAPSQAKLKETVKE